MKDILDLQHKNEPPAPDPIPEEQNDIEERHTLPQKLAKERRFRILAGMERILHILTPGERLLLYGFSALLAASTLGLLISLNDEVSSTVPSSGGTLIEGTIGTPRFVNPLLAISQVDQDLTTLMFSGLMRAEESGDLLPDLAEDYEVSEDGTTYTFHIRSNALFHDGTPVTAADVAFTVGLAQNQDIKSPRRADWDGVSVEATDERTVVFTLPHAYAPFLENTQLGIIPKALWENVTPDEFPFHTLNTHPTGSGPYKIENITVDNVGTPLSYELSAFDDFVLGAPHLEQIFFNFYSNEDALLTAFRAEEIDGFAGVSAERLSLEMKDIRVTRAPSTRIFGVFLNQNRAPVLADKSVRAALSESIDREKLIDDVLLGFGKPALGPIPPGLLSSDESASASSSTDFMETARATLTRGGWKFSAGTTTGTSTEEIAPQWTKGKQVLSFALATADTPELVTTAQNVAENWRALGVDIEVQVYPLSEFNTTVLRPRAYDAVLFGEVVGRTLDLFAFWHSSQRNDPGLNLALYANTRADRLLSDARMEIHRGEREKLYASFSEAIAEDKPAIFLYAPEFLYVVPEHVQNISFGALTTISERFLGVHRWYTDTERVWDIFNNQTIN